MTKTFGLVFNRHGIGILAKKRFSSLTRWVESLFRWDGKITNYVVTNIRTDTNSNNYETRVIFDEVIWKKNKIKITKGDVSINQSVQSLFCTTYISMTWCMNEWMNESATNPAVEHNRNIKLSESPWNQSGWRKWFAEKPSLKFRMKDWASKRRCKWW